MLIYIVFRFRSWKYGVASIAGIFHDVLFVLAFYAIFNVTINNPFIAGILTVVGYSINDTIVIFDRIRENKKIFKKDSNEVVIDRSVNQTPEQIHHDVSDHIDLHGSAVPDGIHFHQRIRAAADGRRTGRNLFLHLPVQPAVL